MLVFIVQTDTHWCPLIKFSFDETHKPNASDEVWAYKKSFSMPLMLSLLIFRSRFTPRKPLWLSLVFLRIWRSLFDILDVETLAWTYLKHFFSPFDLSANLEFRRKSGTVSSAHVWTRCVVKAILFRITLLCGHWCLMVHIMSNCFPVSSMYK